MASAPFDLSGILEAIAAAQRKREQPDADYGFPVSSNPTLFDEGSSDWSKVELPPSYSQPGSQAGGGFGEGTGPGGVALPTQAQQPWLRGHPFAVPNFGQQFQSRFQALQNGAPRLDLGGAGFGFPAGGESSGAGQGLPGGSGDGLSATGDGSGGSGADARFAGAGGDERSEVGGAGAQGAEPSPAGDERPGAPGGSGSAAGATGGRPSPRPQRQKGLSLNDAVSSVKDRLIRSAGGGSLADSKVVTIRSFLKTISRGQAVTPDALEAAFQRAKQGQYAWMRYVAQNGVAGGDFNGTYQPGDPNYQAGYEQRQRQIDAQLDEREGFGQGNVQRKDGSWGVARGPELRLLKERSQRMEDLREGRLGMDGTRAKTESERLRNKANYQIYSTSEMLKPLVEPVARFVVKAGSVMSFAGGAHDEEITQAATSFITDTLAKSFPSNQAQNLAAEIATVGDSDETFEHRWKAGANLAIAFFTSRVGSPVAARALGGTRTLVNTAFVKTFGTKGEEFLKGMQAAIQSRSSQAVRSVLAKAGYSGRELETAAQKVESVFGKGMKAAPGQKGGSYDLGDNKYLGYDRQNNPYFASGPVYGVSGMGKQEIQKLLAEHRPLYFKNDVDYATAAQFIDEMPEKALEKTYVALVHDITSDAGHHPGVLIPEDPFKPFDPHKGDLDLNNRTIYFGKQAVKASDEPMSSWVFHEFAHNYEYHFSPKERFLLEGQYKQEIAGLERPLPYRLDNSSEWWAHLIQDDELMKRYVANLKPTLSPREMKAVSKLIWFQRIAKNTAARSKMTDLFADPFRQYQNVQRDLRGGP